MNLQEVVAVITGGASGMGEATARRIIEAGGKVVLLDVNDEKGENLVGELGVNSCFFHADVTDENSVSEALKQRGDDWERINVLVNCAGRGLPRKILSSRGNHPLEQFESIIQTNLIGTFNVLVQAVTIMKDNEADVDGQRGVVINVASVAAFDGQIGQAAYSASKAGIVGMTLPIARELADYGIRVMTIAPGMIETPMFATLSDEAKRSLEEAIPFPKRLGHASEFAQLVESIIQNTLLNGEVIRLDGGIRMQPR